MTPNDSVDSLSIQSEVNVSEPHIIFSDVPAEAQKPWPGLVKNLSQALAPRKGRLKAGSGSGQGPGTKGHVLRRQAPCPRVIFDVLLNASLSTELRLRPQPRALRILSRTLSPSEPYDSWGQARLKDGRLWGLKGPEP
ncbi:hypothetical protein BDP27DRAFT_1356908 [Rhodocollybia butyracea]|uniref:Uncharacterized protein n=1 Tax=Rhodocollybia butyracea TaxID=206335 RepID=A0A9P5QAJ4_9AGAR|nr:hypothetical protein BDP27DRAFT_1356908 [Rhodocollybia butyracea]